MNKKLKVLPPHVKRQIAEYDSIIANQKKRLQRCVDEPNTISSEAGVPTPIGALARRYENAIKIWQNGRHAIIRGWRKRGYDVSEYKAKKKR